MALAPKKFTSWSFSRYRDYIDCPMKAKLKHLDKIKEPSSPAMDRGTAIHMLAEQYLKGVGRTVPAELKLFADNFKALRKQYASAGIHTLPMTVEDNWAFTVAWTRTRWDDWDNCWVRIKLDCAVFVDEDTLLIKDWKTGKFRDDKNAEYMEQIELYVLAGLLLFERPSLKVQAQLVYLDTGDVYPPVGEAVTHTPADIPRLKKLWEKRVKKMFMDKTFKPTPGNGCRWCMHSKSKGGCCKF